MWLSVLRMRHGGGGGGRINVPYNKMSVCVLRLVFRVYFLDLVQLNCGMNGGVALAIYGFVTCFRFMWSSVRMVG